MLKTPILWLYPRYAGSKNVLGNLLETISTRISLYFPQTRRQCQFFRNGSITRVHELLFLFLEKFLIYKAESFYPLKTYNRHETSLLRVWEAISIHKMLSIKKSREQLELRKNFREKFPHKTQQKRSLQK